MSISTQIAEVIWINGPVVRARGSQHVGMLEVVEVGDEHLIAEVIGLERDVLTIQVYEETSGLRPGAPVFSTGYPLSVELGPGLLQSIFDGIQRPLPILELRSGAFIGRGIKTTPLYRKQKWHFTPRAQVGDPGLQMGGDGGQTDIYSYVRINGEIRYTQPGQITVYNSWDSPVIEGITVKEGDLVTVGVYVKCLGAGAWGKIDDARLNSQ